MVSVRDKSIDAVRGVAIVSMTFGHLAYGSPVERALHLPTWIDGAILFVMLSGLVLGIVQRSRFTKTGRPAYGQILRRVRFLFIVYVLILVLALLIRSLSPEPRSLYSPDDVGGWWNALFLTVTLQMPAPNLTILPMYVVLMVATLFTVWLLAKGLPVVAVAVSGTVWLVGVLFPQWTVMPYLTEVGVPRFNWATWLLPFTLMFILGWYWRQRGAGEWLRTPRVVTVAVVVLAVCWGTAIGVRYFGVGGELGQMLEESLFYKWDLGLGVIVYGAAALVVLYALTAWLSAIRWVRPPLNWLARIGSVSLDSFVILCLVVIIAPAIVSYNKAGLAGMVVAVGALVAMTVWSVARQRNLVPFAAAKSF